MYSLDTVEYYLQQTEPGECYALYAHVHGNRHLIAKRASFKRIEAIHDYILERGCVTIPEVVNEQRVFHTYTNVVHLEIVAPE